MSQTGEASLKKKRLLEGQEQIKSKQEELNWECEGREEEHQQGTKKFETQEILMETQAAKSGNELADAEVCDTVRTGPSSSTSSDRLKATHRQADTRGRCR